MDSIDFGVCRLAIVAVRADPKDTSEQVTQLLFGDHYEVLAVSADKRWLKIRIYQDQCEGWMDSRQHHSISKDYFDQISNTDFKITLDISSPVLYRKIPMTIVLGSIVPVSSTELFKVEEQFAFNGEAKSLGQVRDAEFQKSIIRKYVGSPYQWGGKSPFGIDAPAFVQMVFRICGYSVGRDVKSQAAHGKKVKSLDEARPGDVVILSGKGSTPGHVGILLEEGKIAHASGSVRIDLLMEEGILHAETKIYSHKLHSIRRIF